jgi:hypothetical protein
LSALEKSDSVISRSGEVTHSVVIRGSSLRIRVPGVISWAATSPFPFPEMVSIVQREVCEFWTLPPFCEACAGESGFDVLLGAILGVIIRINNFCTFFGEKVGGEEKSVVFSLLIISSDNNQNGYRNFLGVAKNFEALSFFGKVGERKVQRVIS